MTNFKCRTCGCDLPEEDFRIQTTKYGGKTRMLDCRNCERENAKKRKREKYKTEEGKKAIKESNYKWMHASGRYENRLELCRQKYASDEEYRERLKEKERVFRAEYPEIKKQRASNYYQKNKIEIRARSKEKKQQNPFVRFRRRISRTISEALTAVGSSKAGVSIFTNLPYTVKDLKYHIESHRCWDSSWMSWSNYGKPDSNGWLWNIDHIIPQSMFNYTSMNDAEFKVCWSLENLRPYESKQNSTEGNRKNLLSGFSSFKDIVDKLVEYVNNPTPVDPPIDLIDKFKHIKLDSDVCPSKYAGLEYLDSVLTGRFKSRSTGKKNLVESVSDYETVMRVVAYLISNDKHVNVHSIITNMKFVAKTPGNFFPSAAYMIYKNHCVSGSSVFDPFLGWGGRTLGGVIAGVGRFVGCDLQPNVVDGCQKIASDFATASNTKTEFHNVDSLEFLKNSNEKFGLIFTSPPYFNTENYNVKSDSMGENWLKLFVFPLTEQFRKHLTDDGCVALHLKDITGAPAYTAYYSAMICAGFEEVKKYTYKSGSSSQKICIFKLKERTRNEL